MRILALDTSTSQTSVALWEDGQLRGEHSISAERRVARHLVSVIQGLLEEAGRSPADIQAIAVSQGPGSFTGLRVGLTTAKTFAYVRKIPLVGVNTLEVIAEQAFCPLEGVEADQGYHGPSPLHVVMNAHREQFFAATFAATASSSCETLEETRVIHRQEWLDQLTPDCVVSGPGLSLVRDALPCGVTVVEPRWHLPRAAGVARLAARSLTGESLSNEDLHRQIFSLRPAYHRLSAAEEKRGIT